MNPPIEILVHASGPSRGADDTRYRREVLGFVQFDLAKRHTLLGVESPTSNAVEQTDSHVGTAETEDHLEVQEAVKSSGADKAAHDSKVPDWPGRLPPLGTPGFSGPTASTLPWTATNGTPHLLIERTPAFPRPRTAPTQPTSSQAPPLRHSQSDSWHTPPSVIPNSQPTPSSSGPPAISSSPYLKRPFDSSSPSPTRHASPPAAKRPRLQIPSAPFSSPPSRERPRLEVLSSAPSENPALNESPSSAAAPFSSPSAGNRPRTLEIHPPRPKTSTSAFRTHLTHSLSTIASVLPLAKWFKPAMTTRTPGVLERGHWLVPIDSWDDELKRTFWTFLNDFVGGGQAGWGTWCVRETQEPVRAGDGDGENQAPRPGEVVKIYCWGEVVGEIWIMLFIASGRKIKEVDARWVDAGGAAVVVMR